MFYKVEVHTEHLNTVWEPFEFLNVKAGDM